MGYSASPMAAADLPKAETILDKFVAATGGEAAYRQRHSSFSSGTVEIVGTGLTGTVLAYHKEPNYSYMEMSFPTMGKARQGTDGDIAWVVPPSGGAKIKQGDERALSIVAARFNAEIHWRELYKRVETVGTENVEGKPAYIVVMTPQQGKPITKFFDAGSSLLVKVTLKEQSPTGEQRVELGVGDYRKESGVMEPHRVTQKSGGNTFIIRNDTFRTNEEPPKGIFDPPAEVKALLGKQ
jgi:outer membrane lipoprotein-sorting protein